MLTTCLIVGLALLLLRRGGVSRLLQLRIRWLWLCFVAVGIKLALLALSGWGVTLVQEYGSYFRVLLYGVLLLLLAMNLHIRGMVALLVGMLLNAVVVTANQGRMPVTASALIAVGHPETIDWLNRGLDATHVIASASTRLLVLGDWLYFVVGPFHDVFSPGDVFLGAGLILVLNLLPKSESARTPVPV